MPSEGGEAIQVTEKGGSYALESRNRLFLFYSKPSVPGLWRLPVGEAGEEQQVLSEDVGRSWVVGEHGIYFAVSAPQDYRIRFLDLETGEISDRYHKGGPYEHAGPAVSPDEHWLLFSECPPLHAELMLAENFR